MALVLMRLNHVACRIVKAVGELLFFVQDEDTKAALMETGAEPWSIYSRDELQILVAKTA